MATKSYSGRLAYDPETDFHLSEDDQPVVTHDGGKTWQYATDEDTSHYDRYHESFATVDMTANAPEGEREPHHDEVQPDDPHFKRLRFHPDAKAPTVTSHTEAKHDE